MTIGTRVTHKRYSFLVGEIRQVGECGEQVTVKWEQERYPRPERVADLRPTPVQP